MPDRETRPPRLKPCDPPASRCKALRAGSGLAQTDTHRLTLYFFGTGPARRDTQITRFGDLSAKITKRSEDVDRLKATRQAGCPDRLIGTHGEHIPLGKYRIPTGCAS